MIGKFDSMLPAVLAALILGAADELMAVTQLSSALDIFASFCSSISVSKLQVI